jgi:hypothetical protein
MSGISLQAKKAFPDLSQSRRIARLLSHRPRQFRRAAVTEQSNMIREILSSDVEAARRLLEGCHSDAEILAYLQSRSIEPAKAAELLADLRQGRPVKVELLPPLGTGGGPETIHGAHHHHHHHHHKHGRQDIPWWFVLLGAIFLGALGYCLLEWRDTIVTEKLDMDRHAVAPELQKHRPQ